MTDRLDEIREACARPLAHPDQAVLRAWGGDALAWLLQQQERLSDIPFPGPVSRAALDAVLAQPLPEVGTSFESVFATFQQEIAPYACRIDHPRFLAFIPCAPTFVSVIADLLCSGTNFFAGVWREAAGPAAVELVVLDWFRTLLGMPPAAAGSLTAGGSQANLTALAVARDCLAVDDRARAVLYMSEQRHGSIDRAAHLLGFLPHQLRPVSCDSDYRLSMPALVRAVDEDRAANRVPWAVVANAGATNTGAVDPLNPVADFCAAQQLWLHIDAAYGWAAVLSEQGQADLAGIGRCDSVTLDPHKWLAQPYDVGCVLVRDGARLRAAFGMRPDYMRDVEARGDEVNFSDLGIALTRSFRALKIWLSFKVLGVSWFRALVARSYQLADFAESLLEADECFEVLSPRKLSIVCFRFRPVGWGEERLNQLNFDLIEAVRATGRAFLSSTLLAGQVAIRLCFVNWRTTAADVEAVIQLLREQGQGLAKV